MKTFRSGNGVMTFCEPRCGLQNFQILHKKLFLQMPPIIVSIGLAFAWNANEKPLWSFWRNRLSLLDSCSILLDRRMRSQFEEVEKTQQLIREPVDFAGFANQKRILRFANFWNPFEPENLRLGVVMTELGGNAMSFHGV